MSPLSFALLGSGEFEPWTEEVDRWALARTAPGAGDGQIPPRVLVLPAASAPEGEQVFKMWADMGLAHYGRLGIDAEVVPIKTRNDADRPEHVARLDGASMAFFSGGNPAHLVSVLSGSRFWEALLSKLHRGTIAYAGCSAGMACLGETAVDSATRSFGPEAWKPGLRLFPNLDFGPHWDALDTYLPGIRDMIVSAVPPGRRLVAIDERTAIAGDGEDWRVMGMGSAHIYLDGAWRHFRTGQRFAEALWRSSTRPVSQRD